MTPQDNGRTGLKVTRSNYDEVFTDMVRIPSAHRLDRHGCLIPNGTVIRIVNNGNRAYAIVRGLGDVKSPVIQMDEFIRDRLKVDPGGIIERDCIRPARAWEKVVWYVCATNPAVHVPARLAVISIVVGLGSLVLAVFI